MHSESKRREAQWWVELVCEQEVKNEREGESTGKKENQINHTKWLKGRIHYHHSSQNKSIYLYCGSVWNLKRDRERISGEKYLFRRITHRLSFSALPTPSLPACLSLELKLCCLQKQHNSALVSQYGGWAEQSRAAHNLNAMQSRQQHYWPTLAVSCKVGRSYSILNLGNVFLPSEMYIQSILKQRSWK